MKIEDYKYQVWNENKSGSVVFILSDKENGLPKRISEKIGITDEEIKMLNNAKKIVMQEQEKHGIPFCAITFPDDRRSMRAIAVFPLDRDPKDMEFSNPNLIPRYEDQVDAKPYCIQ